MTQKEIAKFLANTKVYVNGKSKEIQEKLFSLGYYWSVGKGTEVANEDKPFLFIYKNHDITYGRDMCNFIQHENSEISAEEILSLELTEPSYRPFKDKEECWQEMLKHQPFGWIKKKDGSYINKLIVMDEKEGYGKFLEESITFADSEPFGIKED